MTQQIIHQNGQVLQWQDTDQFNYAQPHEGVEVMQVTPLQWKKQGDLKWVSNGSLTDVAPPAIEPKSYPAIRFSSLDYLAKFTDEEYAAARSGPMAIQRGLDSLIAAQFVDVTDPRVDKYLYGLVAAKIIGKTRKSELLAPAHLIGLSQTKGK